jgi:hypothetical protein
MAEDGKVPLRTYMTWRVDPDDERNPKAPPSPDEVILALLIASFRKDWDDVSNIVEVLQKFYGTYTDEAMLDIATGRIEVWFVQSVKPAEA